MALNIYGSKNDYLQRPEFRVVYGMLLKIKEHQAKLLAVLRNKKSTTSTEIRSIDKKIFSHDKLSRNTDVTDSDLFSDMVATQVLDDYTKSSTSENTSKGSASDSDSSTNPSFENPSLDIDHIFTQKNILHAIKKEKKTNQQNNKIAKKLDDFGDAKFATNIQRDAPKMHPSFS
jgi:hypothetical protein